MSTNNVDFTPGGYITVHGADHVRFLQGMTTMNVETLAVGTQGWAAILSPKGRVLSIFLMGRHPDHVWICCEPSLTESTLALLEKYAVMDDVTFELIPGPKYRTINNAAELWTAPMQFGEALCMPVEQAHVLRVEAGIPAYGVDVDESNFPFETVLAQFLDYKKGCYVGQEPVFRVYAQGQSQKLMRGLRIVGDIPPVGTKLSTPSRPDAGKITSVAHSPRYGNIAMAYVHRSAWEPGTQVSFQDAPGTATVVALPMTDVIPDAPAAQAPTTDKVEPAGAVTP